MRNLWFRDIIAALGLVAFVCGALILSATGAQLLKGLEISFR